MSFLCDQARNHNAVVAARAIRTLLAAKTDAYQVRLRAEFTAEHFSLAEVRSMPAVLAASVVSAMADDGLLAEVVVRETRITVRQTACANGFLTDDTVIRLAFEQADWRPNDSHVPELRVALAKRLADRLSDGSLARKVWGIYPQIVQEHRHIAEYTIAKPLLDTGVREFPELLAQIPTWAMTAGQYTWQHRLMGMLVSSHREFALATVASQGLLGPLFDRHFGAVPYASWRPYVDDVLTDIIRPSALSQIIEDPPTPEHRDRAFEIAQAGGWKLSAGAYAALEPAQLAQVTYPVSQVSGLAAALIWKNWGELELAWVTGEGLADSFNGTPSDFIAVVTQCLS